MNPGRTIICGILASVLLASGAAPAAAEPQPEFLLRLDDVDAGPLRSGELVNQGTAAVRSDVLTNAGVGATALLRRESLSRGYVRFPVSESSDADQAILRFTPEGPEDVLLPGQRPFTFGADVRLLGTPGSDADHGNNVLQRGRFGGGQYKLQVDRGRASCRVAGDEGAVMVYDVSSGEPQELDRSVWYRLGCDVERSDAGTARLRLTVLDVTSGEVRRTTSEWSGVGAVRPSAHALDVGGVTPSDTRGNDQLEGDVDRLFVDVS